MGRNKLSPSDRNYNYNKGIMDMLNRKNPDEINKFISTIRSKTIQDLLRFWTAELFDLGFYVKKSPKQLSQSFKVSERKIYDLIKAGCFISNLSSVIGNS